MEAAFLHHGSNENVCHTKSYRYVQAISNSFDRIPIKIPYFQGLKHSHKSVPWIKAWQNNSSPETVFVCLLPNLEESVECKIV